MEVSTKQFRKRNAILHYLQSVTNHPSAEMVFTRRLHCAMACLAMGTPVLLLYNSDYEDVTRFAPMDQMVRTLPVDAFLHQLHTSGLVYA